jgi:hypothetical protein
MLDFTQLTPRAETRWWEEHVGASSSAGGVVLRSTELDGDSQAAGGAVVLVASHWGWGEVCHQTWEDEESLSVQSTPSGTSPSLSSSRSACRQRHSTVGVRREGEVDLGHFGLGRSCELGRFGPGHAKCVRGKRATGAVCQAWGNKLVFSFCKKQLVLNLCKFISEYLMMLNSWN